MNASTLTLTGLINNATLLLVLGILYDIVGYRLWRRSAFLTQLITGMTLGAIGIAVMLTPWQFSPGVIFDTRSVLLSVSGLFFGASPTLLAILMTSAFRLYLGGAGVWTGIAIIVTSGAIGVAWRRFRRHKLADMSISELYVMSVAVHITMLLWMFSLPWLLPLDVLSRISLPVLAIHPLVTALLGWLMVNRLTRYRAEEALRESLQTSAGIVEAMPAGLFVYQHEPPDRLVLLDGNPEAERQTGISVDAWRGSEFNEIWPEAHSAGVTRAYLEVMQTGETLEMEDLTYQDERLRGTFRIHAFRMPGDRLGVAFENITEQKVQEQELQEYQKRMLENEKFAAIGRMSSGIAHEINNPLASIRSSAELMKRTLDASPDLLLEQIPRLCARTEKVLRNVDRCRDIVQNLLGVAQRGAGDYQPTDVRQALHETLSAVREDRTENPIICTTKAITLDHIATWSDRGGPPKLAELPPPEEEAAFHVHARPGQLKQVFRNLIDNALAATHGDGSVLIACRAHDDGIEVAVADTGEGIASGNIPYVFEPFFTTKSPGDGTGLGLYMTRRIVENIGGSLECESIEGKGTILRVWLPEGRAQT